MKVVELACILAAMRRPARKLGKDNPD